MSLKPYPEYKDSGVDWLGQIPGSWITSRFGTLVHEIDMRLGQSTAPPLLSVSQRRGVVRRELISDKPPSAVSFENYKCCFPGDLVLNRFNAYRGALGVTGEKGIVSPDYMVLRPNPGTEPKYVEWLLRSDYAENSMKLTMGGIGAADPDKSGFSRINSFDLMRLAVPALSGLEQLMIANYLDTETAEIDAFIVDQEELIAILAERRTATISLAVMKGLNPDAPMKDSGIEWLGIAPRHWSFMKLSRLAPIQESGVSVNGYRDPASDDEIGVLKTGASSKGFFDPSENKKVSEEDSGRVSCPVRYGWLLINRANTPELVGSAAFVDHAPTKLFLSDKLWQVDFPTAENKFMYWWMSSTAYKSQLQFHRVGASSSMQNLSYSDFKSLDIAAPPIDEQQQIAASLDQETAELDAAIADAREAIVLSNERRAAVISAAVTGKIDVRGLVATATEVEVDSVDVA